MKELGFLEAIKTVHNMARRADSKRYYLFLFVSVLCSLQAFVYLASTEGIINSVYSLAMGEVEWRRTAVLIVSFGLLEGIFMLLGLFRDRVWMNFQYAFHYHIRDTLNSKLSNVKMEYFETHESMVRIHDVKSWMGEIFPKYVQSIVTYMTTIPLLLIYGTFLSRVNFGYVLIYLVLFVVFNGLMTRKFGNIWSCWDAVQKYDQKQKYYFSLCGNKISHQEYKANRLFGYFTKLWEGAFQECHKERMKIFRKFEGSLQLYRILLNIPYITMLALLSFEVLDGKLQIGFLIMANSLLNAILDSYSNIQWNLMENRTDSRTVSNYRKILAYEEYEQADFLYREGDVRIELPEYCYPQSDQKALKPLSLTLKEGEKLMIVGKNGSGKTTFATILAGLLSVENGIVTVSEKKVGLNRSIACIFQDFYQYQMTIRENIEMGDPGRTFTDREIWELLDTVGLQEKVESLDKGVDTRLGQFDDQGDFSKGQWQRIAIARLLAKKDAGIWILDEPTAYLDPLSEIELYQMIYRVGGEPDCYFHFSQAGICRTDGQNPCFRPWGNRGAGKS